MKADFPIYQKDSPGKVRMNGWPEQSESQLVFREEGMHGTVGLFTNHLKPS